MMDLLTPAGYPYAKCCICEQLRDEWCLYPIKKENHTQNIFVCMDCEEDEKNKEKINNYIRALKISYEISQK